MSALALKILNIIYSRNFNIFFFCINFLKNKEIVFNEKQIIHKIQLKYGQFRINIGLYIHYGPN